jgi:peroxiredoxin
LADFQAQTDEFEQRSTLVLAASVDPLEEARALITEQGITFPVAYGLDYREFARQTGAFYEERRGIIYATGFMLHQDGRLMGAVYSSHAIGRYTAADCLRQIDSQIRQRAGS